MITKIDRRPVKVIPTYGGARSWSNPFGGSAWWNNESISIDELISRIDAGYNAGFRRFVINRPAGDLPNSNNEISTQCWYPMPEWRKNDLINKFKPYWKQYRQIDCTLGTYQGHYIPGHNDVTNLCLGPVGGGAIDNFYCGSSDPGIRNADIKARPDIDFMRENWKPWIDIGLTHIILDNTSPAEKHTSFNETVFAYWLKGIKCCGETIPIGSNGLPLISQVTKVPWLALWRYVRNRERIVGQPFVVDPNETECGIALMNDNSIHIETEPYPATRADMESLHNRGFVLWAWQTDSYDEDIIDITTNRSNSYATTNNPYITKVATVPPGSNPDIASPSTSLPIQID